MRFAKSKVIRSAAIVLFTLAGRTAAAQGALLIGDVVNRETGTPLGHSMVTVLPALHQTFTSDAGVFAFTNMEPGRYRIRAAHIGYAPVEVNVEIPPTGAPPRLKIELTHLSMQLATVRVTAASRCTAPGRPNPDKEPDFAAIVAQVRLNAEQYQLLSDSFPYTYHVEQVYQSMHGDSSRFDPKVEHITYRSDGHGWEYKVGDVVERRADGHTLMHLPTLRDFASYDFLNNHCFHFGGIEATRDGNMVRIDFAADVQIRTPDIDGSVYLDAQTYAIRRTELQLSKIPGGLVGQVTAVHVQTIFDEIAPSIDIIKDVHGITYFKHRGWGATIAMTEDQHSFAFEWLGPNPAKPSVQP
jgi:carboxypeptidase family protein